MPTSYPTTALQPGQSGAAVKQLQEWLIQNGYAIPAGATGYYGDQTKTAVAKLQADKGVDTAGYPGYWGPRTTSALAKTASSPAPANNQAEIQRVQAELAKKQEELRLAQENEAKQKEINRIQAEVKAKQDALNKATAAGYGPGGANEGKDIPGNIITPATPGKDTTNFNEPVTGVKFKESGAYKNLSPELQQLVDLGFNVFLKGGENEATAFSEALTRAQALADPYAKSQLALFKAELGTAIAKTKSDFNSRKEILDKTRTELAQDLKDNKEFLSLEQQADMARALKGYDEDLLTIADQAAEKGITFATGARSRALAEERRAGQYQDVIQSDQRKFNFQIKELEMKAARGDSAAQKELDKLNADKGFKLQEIGQNAQRVLGTAGAKEAGIENFTPVEGVLGDIEQQRRKSIIDIASTAIPK